MSTLILWNDTHYARELSAFFGKENVIWSKDQLSVMLEKWTKYSSVVVLCELNWSSKDTGKSIQHLYGIELVKELRRTHNVTLPVLFVSFLSFKALAAEKNKIIRSIGHLFIQLPVHTKIFADLLNNEKRLTPMELLDIQLFSCMPVGIVREKVHQIRNIIAKQHSENGEFIQSQLESCLVEIYSLFPESAELSLSKFRIDFSPLTQENINRALRFIEDEGEKLIEKYDSESGEHFSEFTVKKPWKLLLLDDELTGESNVVKLLESKGVDVVCTTSAVDARMALETDSELRGEITLILTDYRLNKNLDGVEVQQRTQGYTFLEDVGKDFRSKLLSAIVYSGMPRQFLLETFSTFRIQTEIFSKKDFRLNDTSAINYLVSRIMETGAANYQALLALPLASDGWRDNLHNTYLLYRSQKDYKRRERELSDFCTDWIERFRTGQNPATPMIKGDAFKPLLKETEMQTLERFEAYLKTRRLAQYLNLYFERDKSSDPLDIIPQLLSFPGKKVETATAKRGFFSQIIGFKRDEFPFGATIEELIWFDRDMQIPVLSDYRKFRENFNATENLIGTFISSVHRLQSKLTKSNYKYTDKRSQEVNFNQKTFNPMLFDKSDFGMCMVWLDSQKENLSATELAEYLQLIKKLKEIWK